MDYTDLLPPARAFFETPEACFHLLQQLPIAIALFTPKDELIFANPACLTLADGWQANCDAARFPLLHEGRLVYTLCLPTTARPRREHPEVTRAKAYIAANWREDFCPERVAKALNISVRQLYNLFQKHTDTSPAEYHKRCRVEHIKQALGDPTLTICEAFSACGQDSRGWIARAFKQITGLSPRQYRAELCEGRRG